MKIDTAKLKKLLIRILPYLMVGLVCTNFGEAWRLAEGVDASEKMLSFFSMIGTAFENPFPSLHSLDLFVGALAGAAMWLAVYLRGKNAKHYRHNQEYGSARWSA